MIIREAKASDAKNLACLIQHVEENAEYMLWEPGERRLHSEDQLKMIERMENSLNSSIFVAEMNHKLIGYIFAIGGNVKRNKHSIYIVVGIHKDYRGKGVGSLLFEKLEQWALNLQIHRLELTAVTHNEAGLSLYKKMGFEIEGTKRDSLLIDGEYVDEYYMAKIFKTR